MELQHEKKNLLLRKSENYRNALQEEANLISERTGKIITNAVLIGGALAISYIVIRQFMGSKPKRNKQKQIKLISSSPVQETPVMKEQKNPGLLGEIGTTVVSHATAFLLTLAKEKLMEYLQSQAEKKAQKDENP